VSLVAASLATAERRLIALGGLLVLLAMLGGLVIGAFPHVELLLSAHLAATMSGTLLIAVGAGLHKLTLSDRQRGLLVLTLAGSGYLNWVATLLGAVLGTSLLTPVHGAGTASMVGEAVVGLMLVAMVLCTLVGLAILIRGATSPAR
jgi:hypothetical protein